MYKKIMYIMAIIILFLSINIGYTKTYAANTIDDVINGADDFLKSGESIQQANTLDEKGLKETSDFIFSLLLGIAMIVAVIVGMVIGIRFMSEGVEGKAKIKEELLPYFVGCVVIFGAFAIWKLAVSILSLW